MPDPAWTLDFDMIPLPFVLMADFEAIASEIQNFEDPMRQAVHDVMTTSIGQNFDAGGRPPWPELSPDTLANKSYYGYGEAILVRTGTLEQVARSEDIWTIDKDSAFVESLPDEVSYGLVHQSGADSSGNGARIPERPFLLIQPEDFDRIEEIFDNWIGEVTGRHGF